MINYNAPSTQVSLLKTYTGFIKSAVWQSLNTNPHTIISPTGISYIFPVAFYYMFRGSVSGGTQPLYLNTPYQASLGTGAMTNSTIAPANSSGVYSMYPAGADFYYPETSSIFFDPNMNYLQLWQSINQPAVSVSGDTPYVLYYYEVDYDNFQPI
jgi:hypothetical protein